VPILLICATFAKAKKKGKPKKYDVMVKRLVGWLKTSDKTNLNPTRPFPNFTPRTLSLLITLSHSQAPLLLKKINKQSLFKLYLRESDNLASGMSINRLFSLIRLSNKSPG
jgi:hypothetical protein